jgi:hypothetical protein
MAGLGGAEMGVYGLGRTRRTRSPEPSWRTVIAATIRLWFERHHRARRRKGDLLALAAVLAFGIMAVVATEVMVQRGTPSVAAPSRKVPAHSDAAHSGPAQPASGAAAEASLQAAAATRRQAAAWIAGQVAADAIVACDPAMCAALESSGLPASRLLMLGPSSADPLGSDVVVATPAVRNEFGARLASVYAPLVIASFGSGAGRIDIRAVAPDGAAAYESSLAADRSARVTAGKQLLRNRDISVSASARVALTAGEVDPRLLVMLAALAAQQPVRIVAFGDPSPGASPAVPLRGADIRPARASARPQALLSFLDAQQPPYRPAQISVGSSALTVEYAAPSPLGLLSGP